MSMGELVLIVLAYERLDLISSRDTEACASTCLVIDVYLENLLRFLSYVGIEPTSFRISAFLSQVHVTGTLSFETRF